MKRAMIVAAALAAVLVAVVGGWLTGELNRTQASLRATEATLRHESAILTATRGDLSTTVVQLNDTIAALGQTQADLGAERLTRNQLQEDKTALVSENASVTGSLQSANTENITLTADLTAAVAREASLTSDLATETSAHTRTRAALSSLEAEHQELTRTANEYISLYSEVEALRSEIASLQEQRWPLLLRTKRDGLACTGSMEPKLTCLDEVTILRNYAPRDITVGTIVVFQGEQECAQWHHLGWSFGQELRTCVQYHRPQIIHHFLEIGSHSYLIKGDSNRESDGWIAVDDVLGYVIQVHRNVHPENTTLRNAINAAKARLDATEQALEVAEARYEARTNEYCGVNVGCRVYYYDESDPIYIAFQQYEQAYMHFKNAFDTYGCWYKNAEDSLYPGHIPRSCG